MNRNRIRTLGALLCAGFAILLLAGCGEEKKEPKKQVREDSALEKVAGLKKRLKQLDDTMSQMDREANIQKERVQAAKQEINALRKLFERGTPEEFIYDASTTAALLNTYTVAQPAGPDRPVADQVTEEDREKARSGVISTLVILLFGLFSGVYLIKMYRDRANAPGTRADRPSHRTFEASPRAMTSSEPSAPASPADDEPTPTDKA